MLTTVDSTMQTLHLAKGSQLGRSLQPGGASGRKCTASDELLVGQKQPRELGRGGLIFKAGCLLPVIQQSSLGTVYVSGAKLGPLGERREEREKEYLLTSCNAVSKQRSDLHGIPGGSQLGRLILPLVGCVTLSM